MVLDEPTFGFRYGNIEEVKNHLNLSSTTIIILLFSTHDIELAIELAINLRNWLSNSWWKKKQTYGSIVAKYDLREMGICWKESDDHDKL
jgi:polar amino acid transport system ATP-binding protein